MRGFRGLAVWQKAHALTLAVYRVTATFPPAERFGLTQQLRRASVSVGSNIAEACGRGSEADFRRCIHIAPGSANETDYQLLLARDLDMLPSDTYVALATPCTEVERMLVSLIKRAHPIP